MTPNHSPSPQMHKMHASSKHAADVSRLLEPSYRSASTSTGYVSQAYVDPYGDLHDPDYRHFPTSFPSSSSSSAKRSPRPHWDLTLDNSNAEDDDDDELDEDDSFFLSTSTAARPQNHSRYTATRRISHGRIRPGESSFSIYNNTTNYYSPPTTISTLPTSYESDKTDLSRCSDADEKTKKRRRLSREKEKDREGLWGGVAAPETYYRGSLEYSRDLPPTQEEEAGDVRVGASVTSPKRTIREGEYVPTCSQSLRRQWQAFSLRFRFGVFRAQRNVMRRVHLFL